MPQASSGQGRGGGVSFAMEMGRAAPRGGLMELHLSEEERELVLEILERRDLELQKEIRHTDHREFKQTLREKEKLIEGILDRVYSSAVA